MNKAEVVELKKVAKMLRMGEESYSDTGRSVMTLYSCEFLPCKHAQVMPVTQFVKGATRVWRETWILPVLDKLVTKYEKKGKR